MFSYFHRTCKIASDGFCPGNINSPSFQGLENESTAQMGVLKR